MPFSVALRLALRRLRRRLRTTLAATLALAVATGILAFVIAVTSGQDAYLRDRLEGISPDVVLLPERLEPLVPQRLVDVPNGVVELVVNTAPSDRREIKPRVEIATRARRSNRAIATVAPYVQLRAAYRNGARYAPVEIRGVDPSLERGIGPEAHRLRGRFDGLRGNQNATVIGAGLARRLHVERGDNLTMITTAGGIRTLRVAGIFSTDVVALDDGRAYINLELAQSLKGMARNTVSGFSLYVTRPELAARAARSVEGATGYRASTWEQLHASTLATHRRRIVALWVVAVLLVVVAALALSNALLAGTLMSERDVAIVETMGATHGGVARVVLIEGTVVGLLGAALGGVFGGIASVIASRGGFVVPAFVEQHVRFQGAAIAHHPAVYAAAALVAILLAMVAAIGPARSAARVVPLDALREEAA